MKRYFLLIAMFVIWCYIVSSCPAVDSIEEVQVLGMIKGKQYQEDFSTYNAGIKAWQYHPEEYLVTITYEDISETFNTQTLYESVKKGDTVQIILCNGYDKEGNLIWQGLRLLE